jgi:pimeloyl-ACP methyl ester carboxylesterase
MPRCDVAGASLHYRLEGSGPAVVLLPGWTLSGALFEPAAAALRERHTVLRIDPRGHGRSPATAEGHTIGQYAEDLSAVLEQLALRRPLLVGHSMGAMVAFEHLRRRGDADVAGLVVIDQPPYYIRRTPEDPLGLFSWEQIADTAAALQDDQRAALTDMVAGMIEQPGSPLVEAIVDDMSSVDASTAATLIVSMCLPDYSELLERISVPVLLAFASGSKGRSEAAARWMAQRLPDATVELFARSAHFPHMEEPEPFHAALATFARRVAR